MARFAVIFPAAGKSSRFAGNVDLSIPNQSSRTKKIFAQLGGRPVFMHAVEKFVNREDVAQLILVLAPDDREYFEMRFHAEAAFLGLHLVDGGVDRAESVANALAVLKDDVDHVAVHDAARPLVAEEWIDAVFAAAVEHGAAILGTPVAGTLKRVDSDEAILETVSRDQLWEAQTPQVFRREWLEQAHHARNGRAVTDDAQLLEIQGKSVKVVPSSPMNLKLTTAEDLRLAEHLLPALPQKVRDSGMSPFEERDMWR